MHDIIVCGVAGRMGQRLASLVVGSDDLNLVGATEQAGHDSVGKDIGEVVGTRKLGEVVWSHLGEVVEKGRVVISFTTPEATLADAAICAENGVGMVVGTTGLSENQTDEFRRLVSPIACAFAPNYSTAMNVLFKLVQEAASVLGDDYDVEVIEAHHRLKVDAPSGSALRLAQSAADGLGRDLEETTVFGREGLVGERSRSEIGIHAIRAGDLAGDHTVLFAAAGEYIELRHHATSRDAFALGALRAARFVATADAGLYDMGDVLGIK